jgi:hypothetical protein
MKFEQRHQEEQPPPRRFLVQWKDCYHQTIVGPEFLKGRYGLCEQCASNPNEKGTCKVSAYHRRAHIQDVTEITSRLDKRRQHKQQQNDAR